MQNPSHYYDDSSETEDMELQTGTSRMESTRSTGDDIRILEHPGTNGVESTEDRSANSTPSASKTTTKSRSFHEPATFNDNSVALDSQGSMTMDDDDSKGKDDDDHPGNNAGDAGATTEFDAIARDAALLLDKKLEDNRDWVKKLLHEMTAYAKTLSEVHAEYARIQRLEHEESQRLDQVEPDVQGATSHLLQNHMFGGMANQLSVGDSTTTLGSKRKSDQA